MEKEKEETRVKGGAIFKNSKQDGTSKKGYEK